jgi:hypothetical protein
VNWTAGLNKLITHTRKHKTPVGGGAEEYLEIARFTYRELQDRSVCEQPNRVQFLRNLKFGAPFWQC